MLRITSKMKHTTKSKQKTSNRDPVNIDLKNEVLSQRSDPQLMVEPLIELTKFIHVSWLFHNTAESILVLKSLCLSLSSYPANSDGSWYNLFGFLNIDWQSREVINHTMTDQDKTELCLRTFAQHEESTLGLIIEKLASFRRYDALTNAKSHIENLVTYIYSPEGREEWDPASRQAYDLTENNQDDSGIYSLPGDENVHLIIKKRYWEKLYLHLPITLQHIDNIKRTFTTANSTSSYRQTAMSEDYQNAVPVRTAALYKQPKNFKIIFLTFSTDGERAAYRIATKLRTPTPKRQSYGVLILDENERMLSRNPEMNILALFKKVNYVMPVLTVGYLQALTRKSIDPEYTNAMTSMDDRYVKLIFTLMCNEYSDNCYLNDRFHCVIPEGVRYSDLSEQLRGQLVLRSWVNESDIDAFAKKLL